MKKLIVLAALIVGGLTYLGYKYFPKQTDEVKTELEHRAQAKIKSQLPKEYADEFDRALASSKDAAANVNQAKGVLTAVLESHNISLEDRGWIEQQIKTGSPAIQKIMQPILIEVHKHVPEAREWAKKQAQQAFDAHKDQIWKEALKAMSGETASQ